MNIFTESCQICRYITLFLNIDILYFIQNIMVICPFDWYRWVYLAHRLHRMLWCNAQSGSIKYLSRSKSKSRIPIDALAWRMLGGLVGEACRCLHLWCYLVMDGMLQSKGYGCMGLGFRGQIQEVWMMVPWKVSAYPVLWWLDGYPACVW